MTTEVTVRRVSAAQVRPLRHAELRAGRPLTESVYPQDDVPETLHLAAFDTEGLLVACGTFFPEPYAGRPAWRLRGMVSAPEVRGRGYGAALLAAAIARLRADGSTLLWCNARTTALAFYRSFGFTTVGQEFEVVGVPHYRAVLELVDPVAAPVKGTST